MHKKTISIVNSWINIWNLINISVMNNKTIVNDTILYVEDE